MYLKVLLKYIHHLFSYSITEQEIMILFVWQIFKVIGDRIGFFYFAEVVTSPFKHYYLYKIGCMWPKN